MPAGQVQVDVTFELDVDGVLNVTAREAMSGREASVTLQAAGGLDANDLQRIARVHRDTRAS